MSLTRLAFKNLSRNRLRLLLTALGMAVTLLAFILIRTVLEAWSMGAEAAARDRIATSNKVTFVAPLPKRYIETIKQDISGIQAATFVNWFGGRDPSHKDEIFASFAVEPESFLQVYTELSVSPTEKEQWLHHREGVLVGDVLAQKMGWKPGQKITLTSEIFSDQDWSFQIDGIYKATQKSADRSSLYLHWNYLNDSLPEREKNQIGWIVSRIADSTQSASISTAIDKLFEEKEFSTETMSERALNTAFLGMISAVLTALNVVSWVILLIMMLILGNTLAMNTRERIREYGTLRAIGFLPSHIVRWILGEAVLLGFLGGCMGVGLSYLLVNHGMGRFIEENMGQFFPYFRASLRTLGTAVFLAVTLSIVASLLPSYRASRLNVVNALRKIA